MVVELGRRTSTPTLGRVRLKTGVTMNAAMGSLVSSDYDAGGMSRRTAGFRSTSAGPNAVMSASVMKVVDRARAEQRNNPWLRGLACRMVANIVGLGIRPRFQTGDEGLDQDLTDLFDSWAPQADADGVRDYYGLTSHALMGAIESGETFSRLRVRNRSDLTVPLQIQVLERDYVPVEKSMVTGAGNLPVDSTIRHGIEFNKFGQRVNFHMFRWHPNEIRDNPSLPAGTIPVRASEVLHMFDAHFSRPGTVRGEPWTVQVLLRAHDLHRYDLLELDRKKTAAAISGVITRQTPADMTLDQLAQVWGSEAYQGSDGMANVALEGGTMVTLAVGEGITMTQPAEVGGSYNDFQRWQLRAIAASLGMPYEVLSGDYSQLNDRTYRAAVLEFRRICEMRQDHMVTQQFCAPLVRRWQEMALISGAIRLPRSVDERRYFRVRHIPPAWPYIHPLQDVQATEAAIRAGLTSRTEETIRGGYDPEKVEREIAAENARADRLKLKLSSDGRQDIGAKAAAQQPVAA